MLAGKKKGLALVIGMGGKPGRDEDDEPDDSGDDDHEAAVQSAAEELAESLGLKASDVDSDRFADAMKTLLGLMKDHEGDEY